MLTDEGVGNEGKGERQRTDIQGGSLVLWMSELKPQITLELQKYSSELGKFNVIFLYNYGTRF